MLREPTYGEVERPTRYRLAPPTPATPDHNGLVSAGLGQFGIVRGNGPTGCSAITAARIYNEAIAQRYHSRGDLQRYRSGRVLERYA